MQRWKSARGEIVKPLYRAISLSLLLFTALQLGPVATPASAALYTTNLAFQLDANNASSYNGSGNIWADANSSANTFTRASSGVTQPVYSSGTPNSFSFTRTAMSAAAPPTTGTFFSSSTSSGGLGGNDFTVAAWIKTSQVGAGTDHWTLMHILSAEMPGLDNDWGFGITNNGQIAFGTGGSNDGTYYSTAAVNNNTWTFVAATRTYSNNSISLYINGVQVSSPNLLGTNGGANRTLTSKPTLRLGAGDDGGVSFGGNIAAVYGYSSVLTSTQISQNFDATKGSYGFLTATTTSLAVLNATTAYGSIDTLTATVNNSAATGTVNFLNGGSSISGCSAKTVTSGVATCPFAPTSTGTFSNLTAVYSGDSNYGTSTSSAASVTVTQGQPTLTLSASTPISYRVVTSIVTISTPTGSDGKVTFYLNGKKIAGCINLPSSALSTSCSWRPSIHNSATLSAKLTPTSPYFYSVSALPKLVFITARTNKR